VLIVRILWHGSPTLLKVIKSEGSLAILGYKSQTFSIRNNIESFSRYLKQKIERF